MKENNEAGNKDSLTAEQEIDFITGIMYKHSTDESDDGKWIEGKDYHKVAELIFKGLHEYKNTDLDTVVYVPVAKVTDYVLSERYGQEGLFSDTCYLEKVTLSDLIKK